MGVDRADAAIAEQVVAGEQQVAQAKRELPIRVAWRVPNFELLLADADPVAVVHQDFGLHRRHIQMQILGRDLGIGE